MLTNSMKFFLRHNLTLSNSQTEIRIDCPSDLSDESNRTPDKLYSTLTTHNDRAAKIVRVPPDYKFGDLELKGAGQIIAVCDTGLDTGDPDKIHPDFQGRVIAIENYEYNPSNHQSDAEKIVGGLPSPDGPADFDSHGTHVAGSAVGNGSAAKDAPFVPKGIAPEALLYFQSIGQIINWKAPCEMNPPEERPRKRQTLWGIEDNDLSEIFLHAYQKKARIHSNSWGKSGDNELGTYESLAEKVDQFMWTHRDMLILFSAGNMGQDEQLKKGVIDYDTITPPGTAKNCLTVGASENERPHNDLPTPGWDKTWIELITCDGEPLFPGFDEAHHVSDNRNEIALLSSRGEAAKNYPVKPDLVAPGTNILSTLSSRFDSANAEDCNTSPGEPGWGRLSYAPLSDFYCWNGGASMSTALVAGAAALIRQYLTQYRNHEKDGVAPSGALLKAFLINGAAHPLKVAETQEVPNAIYGFGRVDLGESLSLNALEFSQFIDDPGLAIAQEEEHIFEFRVADHTAPVKITLIWTDAPQPQQLSLTNILSLTVWPEGTTPDDKEQSSWPRTNVQRRIYEPSDTINRYYVRIRGETVKEHSPVVPKSNGCPRQDFALVVFNAAAPLTKINLV